MASEVMPPFINSTGLIPKIFAKIQEAQEPERYTIDFQGTVLGYGSGSARPFIPFLKRLRFLESDGRPTEIYRRYRNADTAAAAMADAMRQGFSELFKRNEWCYKLTNDKLKNLVVEVTGKAKTSGSVTAIVASFSACNQLANFETSAAQSTEDHIADAIEDEAKKATPSNYPAAPSPKRLQGEGVSMAFGYNINLNLPNTDDPKVFNAIFRALKENLLDS